MDAADVEAVWRIESARIVAALTRFTGDFALAEDAAQEAVAEALVAWPLATPDNPAGWLMATARRRAIDAIRRRVALQDRYARLAADPAVGPAVDEDLDPDRIDDDILALMFISCHPVLSREAADGGGGRQSWPVRSRHARSLTTHSFSCGNSSMPGTRRTSHFEPATAGSRLAHSTASSFEATSIR